MAYTYILKLNNGCYYVGSCRDLQRRIEQHTRGYVLSTKGKSPLVVVYAHSFDTYSQAASEERRIKGWKKRSSIENLIRHDNNNLIKQGPIV